MHPIATTRETDFTVQDILHYISKKFTATEPLLNDAGVIFLDQSSAKSDVALAEKILVRSLTSRKKTMQYIAYCHLRRANGSATTHTHNALLSYRSNRSNSDVVETASRCLWL